MARKLRARGDRVVYLSELAIEDRIRAAGFDYAPYLADVYPKEARAEASWDCVGSAGVGPIWALS